MIYLIILSISDFLIIFLQILLGAIALSILLIDLIIIAILEFKYKAIMLRLYSEYNSVKYLDTKIIYQSDFESAYLPVISIEKIEKDHLKKRENDENEEEIDSLEPIRDKIDSQDYEILLVSLKYPVTLNAYRELPFRQFLLLNQRNIKIAEKSEQTIITRENALLTGIELYADLQLISFIRSDLPFFCVRSIPSNKFNPIDLETISSALREAYQQEISKKSEQLNNYQSLLKEKEEQIALIERERDIARANAEYIQNQYLMNPDSFTNPDEITMKRIWLYLSLGLNILFLLLILIGV